jgi:hypothetical protein
MMIKHLTAIEWLHLSLHDHIRNCTNEDKKHIKELIRQAKQREREQIINAYASGEHQQGFENEAEQYYNEQYGK